MGVRAKPENRIKIINQLTGDPDECLFFEQMGGVYFWSTKYKVLEAMYELNKNFRLRGEATLDEFYTMLKLPEIYYGDFFGWEEYFGRIFYGYSWIDFYLKYYDSYDKDIPGYFKIVWPFPPHRFDNGYPPDG